MQIEKQIPLVETILSDWQEVVGNDFLGFKNHVYRMIHCCFALQKCSPDEQKKIFIAGCFHDLGIWADNTFDYLDPSVLVAKKYLEANNLTDWFPELELMITEHHKLRRFSNPEYPLVELFRKADLVDVSWGLVLNGISKNDYKELQRAFPNAGFHKILVRKSTNWFLKHPLNPAPMLKW